MTERKKWSASHHRRPTGKRGPMRGAGALLAACALIAGACDQTRPAPTPMSTEAPPSSAITEEQIAFWTLFRRVYDIQADRTWILEVASDPEASSLQFGIPLLPFERSEVAEANASAQNLIPSANRYAADYPGFAGLWLENPRLVLAFTDRVSEHETQLRRLFGPKVVARPARHSLRELGEFARRLRADSDWFKSQEVDVIDISLNEILNGVNLYYRAPTNAIEAIIRERYDQPDWLVPEWAGAPLWTGPLGGVDLTVVDRHGDPVDGSFVLRPLDPGGTAFGPGFLEDGRFSNLGMAAVDWLVEITYVADGVERQVTKAFTVPADDIVKVNIVLDD